MSKNLGKAWWEEFNEQCIEHDHVVIDGRPQKPPKMYDRWLKTLLPEERERIKTARAAKAKENPISEDQARARALVARTRANSKKKKV